MTNPRGPARPSRLLLLRPHPLEPRTAAGWLWLLIVYAVALYAMLRLTGFDQQSAALFAASGGWVLTARRWCLAEQRRFLRGERTRDRCER